MMLFVKRVPERTVKALKLGHVYQRVSRRWATAAVVYRGGARFRHEYAFSRPGPKHGHRV